MRLMRWQLVRLRLLQAGKGTVISISILARLRVPSLPHFRFQTLLLTR